MYIFLKEKQVGEPDIIITVMYFLFLCILKKIKIFYIKKILCEGSIFITSHNFPLEKKVVCIFHSV